MTGFCKNCGGQLDENAPFCLVCGTAINTPPGPVPEQQFPQQGQQFPPPGQQQIPPGQQGFPQQGPQFPQQGLPAPPGGPLKKLL